MYYTNALGLIFGFSISSLCVATAYYGIFLLLFFPKVEKRQIKARSSPSVSIFRIFCYIIFILSFL